MEKWAVAMKMDLRLGRPRMPEPTRMGLDYPSLLSSIPR
jgi:hypothetical protein